jgi:acyl dehydratase
MRSKSEEVQITETDIKHFAIEFDPKADPSGRSRCRQNVILASGWHTAAIAMSLTTKARPRLFGPHPLIGIGVDEITLADASDVVHLEGEIVGLTARDKAARHPAD